MKRAALLLLLLASVARAQNVSLFLDEAPLIDVVKLAYGEIAQRPYILSPAALEARQLLTLSLRDTSPRAVVEHVGGLLKLAGYSVETNAGVVYIDKMKEVEDEIVVYKPRHRSARYLADIVQPLTGAKSLLSRVLPQVQQQQQPAQGANVQRDQAPTSVAGMTDRGEVDQIAFAVPAKDAGKLRKLLADLDTPAGEVLLKAAVYEVGTTQQDGSAIQLALSLAGIEAGIGGTLAGDASIKLKFSGLEGVLAALDRDSRFKSVSRPQVRVKNGAQARFSVGQDVPILGAQQLDRNGNPIQSVDYKPSGIILTARPEVREEVIELELTQELSNFVATNTGVNNSPTLIKRSVNTRLSLVPGEVVILAGLQDDKQDDQQSRLPLFGWLMGDQRQYRQTEILVFIEALKI
jgi:type II secretory pathway component GspD/PulD (secretin)